MIDGSHQVQPLLGLDKSLVAGVFQTTVNVRVAKTDPDMLLHISSQEEVTKVKSTQYKY